MDSSFQLTLEQEFNLRSFAEKVKHLSHDEAQEFLVSLYELMIKKESMYKKLIKQEWGM